MKWKIHWLNDRTIPVRVFLEALWPKDMKAEVAPMEMKEIEIEMAEGEELVIKTWDYGNVLMWRQDGEGKRRREENSAEGF